MAKKKLREVSPNIIVCEPYTAEEQETRFKKDYEFNQPRSVRSPVSGWEDKYIRQGQSNSPSKEVSMVKGTAHRFGGVRSGNSYGKRPAMRRINVK